MNPSIALEQIIAERSENLTSYAKKPDAKEGYIQRENAHIKALTDVYNLIQPLKYQELWEFIENKWEEFEQADARFAGVQLEIRLLPEGALCYLPIKLYQHGI